ncbi:FtsX-like permease family protein [Spirillospora sp. CA-294931]|uniref:FtsX-like permease family protein n=1 Tax=Spirillospora sp. CA-294931 TaxID=3240042 RepID=UPI003D8D5CE3
MTGGFRVALRIARRDALRSKGRTALVVCMIGLPIAAIVAASVLWRTSEWSVKESLSNEIGTADARIRGDARAPVKQDPLEQATAGFTPAADEKPWTTEEVTRKITEKYGRGARVVPLFRGETAAIKTERGYLEAALTQTDLRDPLVRGILRVTEGRAPSSPDEVALSPLFRDRGFAVGSMAQIDREGTRKKVVGYAEDPRQPGDSVAVVLPGAVPASPSTSTTSWLVGVGKPVTWPDVMEFNKSGLTALSRAVVNDPPPASQIPPGSPGGGDTGPASTSTAIAAMIVAMVVLEVVLLAGPAFAVGMRRQRRQLALVAASGGTAGQLRAVVLAGGVVLGGVAAVGGAVLGVGGAALALPFIERATDRMAGPFEVPWLAVLVTMALGAVSGLLAAYVPARQAARMNVVAALGGRREQGRSPRGWPIAGGVLVVGGALLSLVGVRMMREFGAAFGTIAIIVGCVMIGPWVVGTAARGARWLPLSTRLAVRDAARNRGRAAPVVAAIMAAVAGITVLAIANASDFEERRRDYRTRMPMGSALIQAPQDVAEAAGRAVRGELPGVRVVDLRALPGDYSECRHRDTTKCPSVSFAGVGQTDQASPVPAGSTGEGNRAENEFTLDKVVGGPAEARLLLGRDDARVTEALAAGKIVLFRKTPLPAGTVDARVTVWQNDAQKTLRTVKALPAVSVSGTSYVGALVPPKAAAKIGLPVRTVAYGVDRADHRVTKDEQARVTERIAGLTPFEDQVYVERGFTSSNGTIPLVLALAGGAMALGGSLIATGLSAADSRPDLATLAAIGARPRTRRLLMMGQAAFIAVLGCWLGIAAGFIPGLAVARPLTLDDGEKGSPIVVIPWSTLGLIAIVIPLVAALAAALFTRSRLPMVRRTAP